MKTLRTGTDADGIALRLRAMADEEESETLGVLELLKAELIERLRTSGPENDRPTR